MSLLFGRGEKRPWRKVGLAVAFDLRLLIRENLLAIALFAGFSLFLLGAMAFAVPELEQLNSQMTRARAGISSPDVDLWVQAPPEVVPLLEFPDRERYTVSTEPGPADQATLRIPADPWGGVWEIDARERSPARVDRRVRQVLRDARERAALRPEELARLTTADLDVDRNVVVDGLLAVFRRILRAGVLAMMAALWAGVFARALQSALGFASRRDTGATVIGRMGTPASVLWVADLVVIFLTESLRQVFVLALLLFPTAVFLVAFTLLSGRAALGYALLALVNAISAGCTGAFIGTLAASVAGNRSNQAPTVWVPPIVLAMLVVTFAVPEPLAPWVAWVPGLGAPQLVRTGWVGTALGVGAQLGASWLAVRASTWIYGLDEPLLQALQRQLGIPVVARAPAPRIARATHEILPAAPPWSRPPLSRLVAFELKALPWRQLVFRATLLAGLLVLPVLAIPTVTAIVQDAWHTLRPRVTISGDDPAVVDAVLEEIENPLIRTERTEGPVPIDETLAPHVHMHLPAALRVRGEPELTGTEWLRPLARSKGMQGTANRLVVERLGVVPELEWVSKRPVPVEDSLGELGAIRPAVERDDLPAIAAVVLAFALLLGSAMGIDLTERVQSGFHRLLRLRASAGRVWLASLTALVVRDSLVFGVLASVVLAAMFVVVRPEVTVGVGVLATAIPLLGFAAVLVVAASAAWVGAIVRLVGLPRLGQQLLSGTVWLGVLAIVGLGVPAWAPGLGLYATLASWVEHGTAPGWMVVHVGFGALGVALGMAVARFDRSGLEWIADRVIR